MLNRFLLAIIFPSATLSRVLHYALHSCGTAALLFAALDRGPAYGKRSRLWKPFNTVQKDYEKQVASGTLQIEQITKRRRLI